LGQVGGLGELPKVTVIIKRKKKRIEEDETLSKFIKLV